MNDNNGQPDFINALQTELGMAPSADETTPVTPTPADPPKPDNANTPAAPVTPPVPADPPKDDNADVPNDGEETPNPGEAETPKPGEGAQETPEEKANREAQETAAASTEQVKPLTADEVKAAMREYNNETAARISKVHEAREEVISKLYPEGIDRKIYDTNGKAIETAQDIVDRGLINERTGEAFTYEEAASFVLEANRKMTENIEELNKWAEEIAEQNISLHESNERVMSQWGDVLKAMPDLAKELAQEYMTTQLEFDKTGSYITRMAMTPEAYYNRILNPYKQLGEALAAKQALEAKQQEEAQQATQQQQQQERNGLPPQRGTSEVKANTGDPFLDALMDEMKKGN